MKRYVDHYTKQYLIHLYLYLNIFIFISETTPNS